MFVFWVGRQSGGTLSRGDNRIKESDIEIKGDGMSPEASTPVLTLLPGTVHTPETLFTHRAQKRPGL